MDNGTLTTYKITTFSLLEKNKFNVISTCEDLIIHNIHSVTESLKQSNLFKILTSVSF